MIKNYKLTLMVLLVSCSLLNAMQPNSKWTANKGLHALLTAGSSSHQQPIHNKYLIFKNPACYFKKCITFSGTDKKYPKTCDADKELFDLSMNAALKKLGLGELKIGFNNCKANLGVLILPCNRPLIKVQKAFETVSNIYKIIDKDKDVENIVKERDEKFGISNN